jgi:hypothetical protein
VAETCLRLRRNENIFIISSAFVGLFENIEHLINARNMENTKMMFSVLHNRSDRLSSPPSLPFNGVFISAKRP